MDICPAEIIILILILSAAMLLMLSSRDLSAEEKRKTVGNIMEMSVKLEHLDTLNNQRKLDLQVEPGKQQREI